MNQNATVNDGPSVLLAIVGFIFPLLGFVAWVVLRSAKPLEAKSAGQGAAIGFTLQTLGTLAALTVLGRAVSTTPELQREQNSITIPAR